MGIDKFGYDSTIGAENYYIGGNGGAISDYDYGNLIGVKYSRTRKDAVGSDIFISEEDVLKAFNVLVSKSDTRDKEGAIYSLAYKHTTKYWTGYCGREISSGGVKLKASSTVALIEVLKKNKYTPDDFYRITRLFTMIKEEWEE